MPLSDANTSSKWVTMDEYLLLFTTNAYNDAFPLPR